MEVELRRRFGAAVRCAGRIVFWDTADVSSANGLQPQSTFLVRFVPFLCLGRPFSNPDYDAWAELAELYAAEAAFTSGQHEDNLAFLLKILIVTPSRWLLGAHMGGLITDYRVYHGLDK